MLAFALTLGAIVPAGCALTGGRTAKTPATSAILHDPLLGLPFNSTGGAFELAPTYLAQRCPDLDNARYSQQLWIFSAAEQDGQRYLIVAGRFLPRRIGDRSIENALGALLRIGPNDCLLIGPAAELFAMPEAYENSVPAPIRSALAEDAARRILAAHGGASGLGVAMRNAGKTFEVLPPVLRSALPAIPHGSR